MRLRVERIWLKHNLSLVSLYFVSKGIPDTVLLQDSGCRESSSQIRANGKVNSMISGEREKGTSLIRDLIEL